MMLFVQRNNWYLYLVMGYGYFLKKRDSEYFLSKLYGKSYLVNIEKKFIMETMKKIDL